MFVELSGSLALKLRRSGIGVREIFRYEEDGLKVELRRFKRCSRQRVSVARSVIEGLADDLGEAGRRIWFLEEFHVAQLGIFTHDIGAVATGVDDFQFWLA